MDFSFLTVWQKITHFLGNLGNHEELGKLGDFTATGRMIIISLMAIVIGIIAAFVALILLRLIGLITNLTFFGRWAWDLVSPAGNHLGIFVILVPVLGSLVVGFIARYGSERIRGHGIPEAIEAILINGSKVEPKVAILKPIASAIAIGTGGPFGAEGPIIMTGGAIGSLIAQFFRLSSSERKTLLVAGAAAGMAAVFAAPVASVMLAVELMLFEFKPRSIVPVALASAAAAFMRPFLIGTGPLFPTPAYPAAFSVGTILGCLPVGLLAGILASILTLGVYASEDMFRKLPIHWMWWPVIGGFVVGIGGLIFPEALGVGYSVIAQMLQGQLTMTLIVGILIVKTIIWAVSLSSGTSGGVLAPILMIGGALGGVESLFLPHVGPGFWPLISMAAVLGGTLRSPITAVIFTLELTHNVNALLPLLIAVATSYTFTVLTMRRDILTEKVSRRGYHLSKEYATDPLEVLFVREVMRTNMVVLPASISLKDLAQSLNATHEGAVQRLYPIVNDQDELIGVATRKDLQGFIQQHAKNYGQQDYTLSELVNIHPVVAYPDESLRSVIYRMAETGYTRMPVVEREAPHKLVGLISLAAVLQARTRSLEEERKRERVLRMRFLFPTSRPVVKTRQVGKEVSDIEPTPKEPSKPLMD